VEIELGTFRNQQIRRDPFLLFRASWRLVSMRWLHAVIETSSVPLRASSRSPPSWDG